MQKENIWPLIDEAKLLNNIGNFQFVHCKLIFTFISYFNGDNLEITFFFIYL